jgi:hypothetical protein
MAMLRTRRIAYGRIEEGATLDIRDLPIRSLNGPGSPRANVSGQVYTVPAGYRAILRDWRLLMGVSATPEDYGVLPYVILSGGPTIYLEQWNGERGRSSGIGRQTDIVLEAGDTLGLLTNLPPLDYYISGALLTVTAK